MRRMTVGYALRRAGRAGMCGSVVFASLLGESWAATFLLGAFVLGVGIGLGDGPDLRGATAGPLGARGCRR